MAYLKNCDCGIICLQEMCDAEEKILNNEIFKGYNIFVPDLNHHKHDSMDGFNHNVLLSKYPLQNIEEFSFPDTVNKTAPFENAIKTDVNIEGKILRVYNCHFLVRKAGMATRLSQLGAILNDCRDFNGPVIICGDMNLVMPKAGLARKIIRWWQKEPDQEMYVDGKFVRGEEKEIFYQRAQKGGFTEVFDLNTPTWSPFYTKKLELFKLKLDWFLTKNVVVEKSQLGKYISDHKPMEVTIKL